MVTTVYDSYAIWPLQDFAPTFSIQAMAALFGVLEHVVRFALVVAAPLVVMFLISDFALAGLARIGGSIQLESNLPLIKNILFTVLSLLYIGTLTDLLVDGLGETRYVLDVLRAFAPGEAR